MALFRIVEPQDGQILIDGVNVMNIGLNLLRRSICVIPQDPTLFQGDVRYNLDPFAEVPEANMISIL